MKHTIEHDLTDTEVKAALQRAFAEYSVRRRASSPSLVWRDPRHADLVFSVMGLKLSAALELGPRAVHIDMRIPLALRMFQHRVKGAIDKEARRFIADAEKVRGNAAPT